MAWTGVWEGGRIWTGKRGRQTYVIKREIRGKAYEVSTRCTSRRAALAQLDAFEKDPEHYDPRGGEPKSKIVIDDALIDRFIAWSRDEKKNTAKWIDKQRTILEWWSEKLSGKNLRRLDRRRDVKTPLEGAPGRQHKIAVVRVFFRWLRAVENEIEPAEDPILNALEGERSKIGLVTGKKRIVSKSEIAAVLAALPDPEADLLRVMASSGCHLTELVAFAESGAIETLPVIDPDPLIVAVLKLPRHKRGGEFRVRVREDARAAAERVLARGPFSDSAFEKAIRVACKATGVPAFGPGSIRHSVARFAVEAGADEGALGSFLGHRSPITTRKHYTHGSAPRAVPTPI